MCHLRQVRNIYTKCGHGETLNDELIYCESSTCRFSPFHPVSCPRCRETCRQHKRFPEQYSPHKNEFCPGCRQAQASRR